jgi:uncharacterized surface protein with fasciclin (FAS1) repeats
MKSILPRIILMTTAMTSLLFIHQMEAYCARCVKIEEERAKEQAKHPQALAYYDDQISLRTKDDLPHQSQSQESEEKSERLGTLSGASYRVSAEKNENSLEGTDKITSQQEQNGSQEGMGSSQFNQSSASLSSGYSTLYTIFKTKNFLEILDGSFTLFIPTNEALQQLSARTLIELTQPQNAEKLATLVSNHVVARKLLEKDFTQSKSLEVKASSGKNLTLTSKNGHLFVNNSRILRIEPAGYDGVMYIVDKVLYP